MKTFIIQLILIFSLFQGLSQNKNAYQIYTTNGELVTYEKMLSELKNADIILFGELHNNPVSHWLQYETTLDLSQSEQLIMGAEMFEADNQDELNKYLKGEIDQKALDTLARLWPNYKTDYAPLVNLAKDKQISFIATNIPRQYANMVFKKGFESLESLTDEEKSWMAPLPIEYDAELPGYKNMQSMMGGHGGENLPKAQAIKDATMAYFISTSYLPGNKFMHYHGTYHTDNYEGILWYLKKLKPELKYITISTVVQPDVNTLQDENKGKADFIICVDENMTSTY
ncbi:MAG: ChaN family lipoprotein [Bacteroidales bacterium]